MSLLFNILSRLVIAFLPRRKHLLITWLHTIPSSFGAQENKVFHCFHCVPIYFVSQSIGHEVMWLGAMTLVFWVLSFKPSFSLSSFTFIKRLFCCSSLSAIRVVPSAHLSLLIFLPAILILACASSSLAFHMMYSAYKLNKQGDNILPWLYSFPNFEPFHCSTSSSNCCFFDLHADFSGGRSGGLVFPSLEELSSLLWFTTNSSN